MSALAQHIENSPLNASVTSISTNARIDYIHRFSKQAILVVEQGDSAASDIAGQYLGALPDSQNSAYISVSPQHNIIQIRCRLFEQLFGTNLFDPERSLAVTILNFSKGSEHAISIVVEQAQHLPLQVLHELCQLSELAKKTNANIDVLLLGSPEVGRLISENKMLFAGKLSILAGDTGQLLNVNAAIFKKNSPWYTLSKPVVWLISILLVITFALATVIELHQRGVFSFSELIKSTSTAQPTSVDVEPNKASAFNAPIESGKVHGQKIIIDEPTVLESVVAESMTQDVLIPASIITTKHAAVQDVFAALTGKDQEKEQSTNKPANFSVVNVVTNKRSHLTDLSQPTVERTVRESKIITPVESVIAHGNKSEIRPIADLPVLKNAAQSELLPGASWAQLAHDTRISPQYYLKKSTGFVIQLSGFTQYNVFVEFTHYHQLSAFHGYLRRFNDQPFLVITSEIYETRAQAEKALKAMSPTLISAGVWVKSVAAIKNEINAFSAAIN